MIKDDHPHSDQTVNHLQGQRLYSSAKRPIHLQHCKSRPQLFQEVKQCRNKYILHTNQTPETGGLMYLPNQIDDAK